MSITYDLTVPGPHVVVQRAGPGWYRDAAGNLAQANADTPRFDHVFDKALGIWKPGGVYFEPFAATNQAKYSDDIRMTGGAIMSPFNCTTPAADLVVENVSANANAILQFIYDVVFGTSYFISATVTPYANSLAKRYFAIRPARNLPADPFRGVCYDVEAGSLTATRAPAIGGAEPAGLGKTRFWLNNPAASATAPGNHYDFYTGAVDGTANTGLMPPYVMDGVSGLRYSNIQCEADRLSSFIPTNGAPVTRPAETLKIAVDLDGVTDGIYPIRYLLDDLTTPIAATPVVGGMAIVPTNLGRTRIMGATILYPFPPPTRRTATLREIASRAATIGA